jgi:ligand-binding sensor domain-containing protein
MSFLRILIFLILVVSLPVAGQNLAFKNRTFEYQNEPVKVKVMHQDLNGIFWLGTDKGLFRYDGHEYEPVLLSGKKVIKPVTAISESRTGKLWIGCETGQVYHFYNHTLTSFQPKEGLPKESVSAILEDKNSIVWLATNGEGLYYWKQDRLFNLNHDDGLPDNYVYALAEDFKGNVWAATDRGIGICSLKANRKSVQKLSTAQGLPDNLVTALISCKAKETMWVGTYSGGFVSINVSSFKVLVPEVSTNWPYGPVTNLLATETGCIIGADGKHLIEYRQDPHEETIEFTLPVTETRFKISDIQRDTEGFLWVAGNSPDVLTANPMFRFLPVGSSESIHAVLPDKTGNVWFSTDNGIFLARKTANGFSIRAEFTKMQLKGRSVVSMYQDATGYLWFGTFGGGLYRADAETGQIRFIGLKEGLTNENILSISGQGNEIWLATLGGAVHCLITGDMKQFSVPVAFESFNHESGLGINYIYQVFQDSKNRIWFATDGKGLTVLENGKFRTFSNKDGLPGKTIYSVVQTPEGSIWVSVPKYGLYRFDSRKFSAFGGGKKLKEKTLAGLATDPKRNLVVLHKRGIEIIDSGTGQVIFYGEETGLNFNEPDLNTLAADKTGKFWIGVPGQLISFEPASTKIPPAPQIRITSTDLFLKPLNVKPGHQFKHDQNHISFNYAGLWYQNPEAVTYRLKLEGYDREWTVSNNRSITYPNLPPGNYIFKISASANGNFREAAVSEFPFEIAAPFWHTWWFYVLGFMLVSGGLYALVKAREKRLKAAERLEKDKVMFQFETLKNQVNPHFLFNSFNTLVALIEDDQQAAVEYVERMSDFFRNILLYREKDTITLQEELELIRNYYFLQQKRYGSNLNLQVEVPDSELEKQVAPLTLQLLVENAIKHNVVSKQDPLLVEIFTEKDSYLTVRNNLQPKKNAERSTGIGLSNIKSRFAILGKRPVIVRQNDSVFEVKVPLISN